MSDGVLITLRDAYTWWCVGEKYATRNSPEADGVCTLAAFAYKAVVGGASHRIAPYGLPYQE